MAVHAATADRKSWLEAAVAVVLTVASALVKGFADPIEPADADSAYWAFDQAGPFGP